MNKFFLLCWALLLSVGGIAQTTNISGTINTVYTAVNSVDGVTNSANVASTAGLAIGDTVLIIQMQGAAINTTNTASFGDVTALNNAGKYEFAIICDIDVPGSNIVFQYQLVNAYDAGGSVQIVKVETYNNAIVTNTLTAPDWDGTVGGVLVFQATGWVRLRTGNCVMMDNRGFRGGDHLIIPDPCGCAFGGDPIYADFFYPYNDHRGAPKGEGIAPFAANAGGGKGKQANGGGGGNDHNGGGGGGANYGAGGQGGSPCETRSCFFGQYCRGTNPGLGAASLAAQYAPLENRIFMGGGGGAGDDNGGAGSGGTDGGGIVIILADSINGNGANIYARGTQAGTGAGDGAGGGGAGGTVLMAARAFHPSSPMIVHVNGGNGGLSSWADDTRDYNSKGKGGGGGGGVFWISNASVPGNITVNLNGGNAGTEVAPTSCNGQTGGSTAGGNGLALTNLVPPTGFSPFGTCVLPVEYAFVRAVPTAGMVRIEWETLSEEGSSVFEVERSSDGRHFQLLGQVPAGNQFGGRYQYVDPSPFGGTNHYRLRQVDLDGSARYSRVMTVQMDQAGPVLRELYPNPATAGEDLQVEVFLPGQETAQLSVTNAFGQLVYRETLSGSGDTRRLSISTAQWASGVYLIQLDAASSAPIVRRVLISR